ncbi:hypothetical protein ACFWQC_12230 [Nocardioides sp. NPDC058538]|uniref:hypothetical protein n=1 Tax=Nocardioides sp. NPDC058538 TaxID=3346542 RepID=UPI00366841B0
MKKLLTALVVLSVIAGGIYWVVQAATDKLDSILPDLQQCTAVAGEYEARFDPEQMGNAAVITALGLKRGLPARAATIAIATAIQESKLYNISHGDRDSLGLFQQRPSMGWGTEEQVQDPVYATNKFYDALVKIEGYEDMVVTEAAQEVQRSAYPEAYADHEGEGRAIASAITGYSPAALTCRIDEPEAGSGKPQATKTEVNQLLGQMVGRARVDGSTVVIPVDAGETGQRNGWAVAHYVLARASEFGATSIAYDGRTWSAGKDEEWADTPEVDDDQIVVTLA